MNSSLLRYSFSFSVSSKGSISGLKIQSFTALLYTTKQKVFYQVKKNILPLTPKSPFFGELSCNEFFHFPIMEFIQVMAEDNQEKFEFYPL